MTSPQDWLGPDPARVWTCSSVTSLLGIVQVSKALGGLVGADVQVWRALSLTSIVVMFRATGIVRRNVIPGMHSTRPQEAKELSAGPEGCLDKGQGCSANQVVMSIGEQEPANTGAAQMSGSAQIMCGNQTKRPQLHARHFVRSPLSGPMTSEETSSCLAFPLLTSPQLRRVSNAEAELLVKSQVQQALFQMSFADTQVFQVTELLIQESFADIIAVVASQDRLVEFAAKVGQLPCQGMNKGQRPPDLIGMGEESSVPIGSSDVTTAKELGRFDHSDQDKVDELQRSSSATQIFPCDHLTWYVLLREGTIGAYAGRKGLNLLLASSEGLHTIGWGLGCPFQVEKSNQTSQSAKNSQSVSGSGLTTQRPLDSKKVLKGEPKVPIPSSSTDITCPHFLRGFCRYGDGCKFWHQPRSSSSVPWQAAANPRPKEILCKHYVKGYCNRGQYCKFSHETGTAGPAVEEELRERDSAKVAAVQVCPHYARGYCKRGEWCNYSHQAPSADLDAAPASATTPHKQRCQPGSQTQAHKTLSNETMGQEIHRSELVMSGSQESGWQSNPRESISLKDTMTQESQMAHTASRKFTAPRPERHFHKGVKIRKLGSTILKGVCGSKQQVRDKESVDRPKTRQPCVFAPAPYCKPVVPMANVKPSRPDRVSKLPVRCTKLMGVKRRTQHHNAPGTKMKACKPAGMPQPLSLEVRLPWADLVDSESDEQSVCSQEAPSDVQDNQVEVNHVTFELGNQKGVGWRAGGAKPRGISSKRWRRYVGSVLKGKGGSRRLQTNAVVLPCPEKHSSEKDEVMLQDSERSTVWPSSGASRPSSNLDTCGCPPESGREGSGEHLSSFSSKPIAAPGTQPQPLPTIQRQASTRGRSPIPRSLRFSPAPVIDCTPNEPVHTTLLRSRSLNPASFRCSPEPGLSDKHAKAMTQRGLRGKPESRTDHKPVNLQVPKLPESKLVVCQQPGECQVQQMELSGRVSFGTCYGSGSTTASQPEMATSSGHFHIPRSRSLGCSLPLVLTVRSSGRARSCSGHKFPQLLPGVSQHTPTTSKPMCPAGAGGGVPAVRCCSLPAVRCCSQIACSPKHELRNVSKGFNATLGYPGEGPGDRGRVATPSSASAPVTVERGSGGGSAWSGGLILAGCSERVRGGRYSVT